MLSDSNKFDISIKNSSNKNTQINVNFNISSNHSRTLSSPFCSNSMASPSTIIGRKIENSLASPIYQSETFNKYPILVESNIHKKQSSSISQNKKHSIHSITHLNSNMSSNLNSNSTTRKPAKSFQETGLSPGSSILKPKIIAQFQKSQLNSHLQNDLKKGKNENNDNIKKNEAKISISKGQIKMKPKKKKKSKNSRHKKMLSLYETLLHKKPEVSSRSAIDSLIADNIKKKLEEDRKKKLEEELERQKKLTRQRSLHLQNNEIRMKNHIDHPKTFTSPFPWGYNQQKLISFLEKALIYSEANTSKSKKKLEDDNVRREKMGLAFLNDYDPITIKQILDHQKKMLELKEQEEKKAKVTQKPNIDAEQVRMYMEMKRKKNLEEDRLQKLLAIQTIEKKKENLENLKIKSFSTIFSKIKRSYIPHNKNPSLSKANEDEKSPSQLPFENEEALYEFCKHEAKNFSNSKQNEKTRSLDQDKRIPNQNKNLDIKKKEIHNQFMTLSKKLDLQITKYKAAKKKKEIRNSSQNHHREKSSELKPQNEEEEQELLQMVNFAAIIIQKTWRGYQTRKKLNEFVCMMLQEMEENQKENKESESHLSEDEDQFFDENVPQPILEENSPKQVNLKKKRNSRNFIKSHSLDEVYVAGNLFMEKHKDSPIVEEKNNREFDYYGMKNKPFYPEKSPIIKDLEQDDLRQIFKKIDENPDNHIPQSNEQEIMDHSEVSISISAEVNKPVPASISEKNIQISNLLSLPSSCDENPKSDRKQINEENQMDMIKEDESKNLIADSSASSPLNILLQQIQALKDSENVELRNCADNLIEVLKKNISNVSIEKGIRQEKVDQMLQTTPKSSSVSPKNKEKFTPNFMNKKKKRSHLQIDIHEIENEYLNKEENLESKSLDSLKNSINFPDLRRALGSERMIRENSNSLSISQLSPLNLKKSNENLNSSIKSMENTEGQQSENCIFNGNPFREFASKKFKELLNKENMIALIKMREKALNYRHKAQIELMKKMLENKRVSPRTFKNKSDELEKWVSQEKDEIDQTKQELEKGWMTTATTIKRTQRDITFMQKMLTKSEKGSVLRNSLSEDDINYFPNIKLNEKKSETTSEQDLNEIGTSKKITTPKSIGNSTKNITINEKFIQKTDIIFEKKPIDEIDENQILITEKIIENYDFPPLPELNLIVHQDSQKEIEIKEKEKVVDQITQTILEGILEELRKNSNFNELIEKHKNDLFSKTPIFVGGKDVQEHFPPISSPNKEGTNQKKKGKDSFSPKNINLSQRVKSEPDEKSGKQSCAVSCNIEAVKEYLTDLIDFIKKKHFDGCLKRINSPLGLQPQDKLRLLQMNIVDDTNESENYENGYMYPAFYKEPILTTELFTDLEKLLFKKKFLLNPKNKYELQQIHNKAIFDCFNEALDFFRPFGMKGRPSPWKVNPLQLFTKIIKNENFESILEKSKERVLEWSSNLCGFIHDKEDSQFLEGLALDEECIAQIREDRMARMLAQEVIDCEEEWVDYEDEETEVGVELADLVFEKILNEGVEQMLMIGQQRKNLNYFGI